MNTVLKLFSILFLAILIPACSIGGKTKSSQFYVLDAKIEKPASDALSGLSLGVGPIAISGYIDRPQMVTKTDTAELRLEEFARWAEPVDEMFTRTLAQNIRVLTNSQEIHSHPWSNLVEFDYRVGAKVIRFENNLQGDALLVVHWGLFDANDTDEIKITHSEYRAAAVDPSYPARVDALNDTLAQFARDIVASLN